MKHILFLDDDDNRHAAFAIRIQQIALEEGVSHKVTHVHTADECIGKLKSTKWNLVSLDHDLDLLWDKPEHPGNGMDVANFIANHMDTAMWPSVIIIHSHNTECAIEMENLIKQAGHTQCGRLEFSIKEDES